MNNLLSYCGLVDAKIRASDIDLPVSNQLNELKFIPFFCDSVSLSCKSFRVPVQLEPLFSLKKKSGEVELFHFISIFLSSAGKVRGRAARSARASGRRPIGYRKSYTQLWRPNVAFPESHDDGKEGADLPIIQPKWQSDINGRSTPFVLGCSMSAAEYIIIYPI